MLEKKPMPGKESSICSWSSDLLPKETDVGGYSLVLFRSAESVAVRLQMQVRCISPEAEISSINRDLSRNVQGQAFLFLHSCVQGSDFHRQGLLFSSSLLINQ